MVIQMKAKEVVEANIFSKGDEPLFEWLQSMQFKAKMIQSTEKGLKEIEDKVNETQDKVFELMKVLHVDSQTSSQGKVLIEINVMKEKFSRFLDSLFDINFHSQDRVVELQALGRCIHVAKEELQNQLNELKELARENSK